MSDNGRLGLRVATRTPPAFRFSNKKTRRLCRRQECAPFPGRCKAARKSGLSSLWGSEDLADSVDDGDSWPAGLDPYTSTPMDVVLEYYEAINERRLEDATALYADGCTHENLAFSQAAVGKQACIDFVSDFCDNVPSDLRFVIDDISGARSVGVIWHMEVGGKDLPLGKGMSFYQVDSRGKISYVRECPEHFAKLASASPLLLRLSAPFIRELRILPEGIATAIGDELQRAASSVMDSMDNVVPSLPPVELPAIDLQELLSGIPSGSFDSFQSQSFDSAATAADVSSAEAGGLQRSEGDGPSDLLSSSDSVVNGLIGTWKRKSRLSDEKSYNKALSIMGMGGIMQQVADVIDGRTLTHEVGVGQGVRVRFLASRVPGFPELYEDYQFSEWTEMDRRDQQPGKQQCRAFMSEDNKLQLTVELGPSKAWSATDTYHLVSSNELHVQSDIKGPDGKQATVIMAYSKGK